MINVTVRNQYPDQHGKIDDVIAWTRPFVVPVLKDARVHYGDVIMGVLASQITSLAIVFSTVHSGADQRKHQSSTSLAFVRGIHRRPMNSPHKWPVTRKMFPFLMTSSWISVCFHHSATHVGLLVNRSGQWMWSHVKFYGRSSSISVVYSKDIYLSTIDYQYNRAFPLLRRINAWDMNSD